VAWARRAGLGTGSAGRGTMHQNWVFRDEDVFGGKNEEAPAGKSPTGASSGPEDNCL